MYLGHHDAIFSKDKEYLYNANSLKNAETHLREVHMLNKGGDVWRVASNNTPAQASGTVDNSYEYVIPFHQKEFKNAFLE
jgi:hypothetical protein